MFVFEVKIRRWFFVWEYKIYSWSSWIENDPFEFHASVVCFDVFKGNATAVDENVPQTLSLKWSRNCSIYT